MAMDFTVIQSVRQRFGDSDREDDSPQELEAPFVGLSKDFRFSCPQVDSGQMGVLQFESLGVTAGIVQIFVPEPQRQRNILRINGVDVPGAITPNATTQVSSRDVQHYWKTHSLIVPANVLREENVLHIESVNILRTDGRQFDNFIIDNVLVFFKTRGSQPPVGTKI